MRAVSKTIGDWVFRTLMVLLIGIISYTTRKTWINRHVLDILRGEGRNFIVSSWHNHLLCFIQPMGQLKLTTLVSKSRDGANIAWVNEFYGMQTIQGSSTRGGFEATRKLYRLLSKGGSAAITPDGPLGPRYVLKEGIVILAKRAQVPIIPLAWAGRKMVEFNSWDRMRLPFPFSRMIYYVGDPVIIAPDEDDAHAHQRVQNALSRAEVIVHNFVGSDRVAREPVLTELMRKEELGQPFGTQDQPPTPPAS